MDIKDKTIALLIDFDNISKKYIPSVFKELKRYGSVIYRKLYGDFTKHSKTNRDELNNMLLDYSIEQVQQIAYTKGKNATDIRLVIDAMDILQNDKVNCFCIATSDSDYTSLAIRLRKNNITIIGAGKDQTPSSFKKACDLFITIDKLPKSSEDENDQTNEKQTINEVKNENNSEQLIKISRQILKDHASNDQMSFNNFMRILHKEDKNFNPENYGHKMPKQVFKDLKDKDGNTIFTMEQKGNSYTIKLS